MLCAFTPVGGASKRNFILMLPVHPYIQQIYSMFITLSYFNCFNSILSDLFNLPLPPLWTVVLGEHNRMIESGHEQRISVEKIVFHEKYENFQHDLGMALHRLFHA